MRFHGVSSRNVVKAQEAVDGNCVGWDGRCSGVALDAKRAVCDVVSLTPCQANLVCIGGLPPRGPVDRRDDLIGACTRREEWPFAPPGGRIQDEGC